MRCQRFRGLEVSFGCCSGLLCLGTHWLEGRTVICPRAVGRPCEWCRGLRPKLLGYAAVRVQAQGSFGTEILLGEFPPSMVELLHRHVDPTEDPFLWRPEVKGLLLSCTRPSVRSAWLMTSRAQCQPKVAASAADVFEAVGRIYRLRPAPGTSELGFAERFGEFIAGAADGAALLLGRA
jgi:hypothetical protein